MELNSSDNLVHRYDIEILNLSDPVKSFLLSELISLKFIQY